MLKNNLPQQWQAQVSNDGETENVGLNYGKIPGCNIWKHYFFFFFLRKRESSGVKQFPTAIGFVCLSEYSGA